MRQDNYRAVLVGLGNIAWRFDQNNLSNQDLTHASAYLQHSHTRIVGGCSPNQIDCQDFYETYNLPTYKTILELLDKQKPDIVSICSPSEYHYQQVCQCIEREIPMVWLEKPPVNTLTQLDQLLQLQVTFNNKTKILVNYQRRYLTSYQQLKNFFVGKQLGACQLIQINYSRGLETNGSHLLDILFFIVGDQLPYTLEWISKTGHTDNPSFSLLFEDELRVLVSGINLPYHCIDISLTCDGGRVGVFHGGMTPYLELKHDHELFPGFYRLKTDAQHQFLTTGGVNGGMTEALNDLIDSTEKKSYLKSDLSTARNSQALIYAVRNKQQDLL